MIRLKLKSWFHVCISTWNVQISLWNAQNSWFPLISVSILGIGDWRLMADLYNAHISSEMGSIHVRMSAFWKTFAGYGNSLSLFVRLRNTNWIVSDERSHKKFTWWNISLHSVIFRNWVTFANFASGNSQFKPYCRMMWWISIVHVVLGLTCRCNRPNIPHPPKLLWRIVRPSQSIPSVHLACSMVPPNVLAWQLQKLSQYQNTNNSCVISIGLNKNN